jgi:hypothetical protein
METFNRICIKDYDMKDNHNQEFKLKRGNEYLTSREENGRVMVFSKYWVWVPAKIFAGEIKFT